MDNNLKNQTNRTERPSSSPMSAEEKLKRSMKGLSHTGSGGGGGINLNSANLNTSQSGGSRKKVGGVVLDVETIQDAHKQKLETKGRRNNVIILVLSLLLVVSLVYLAIAIIGYNNSKREPNFKYRVEGDASASWIIEGKNDTEFLIRDGLKPDMIYLVDSKLQITTTESVEVYIQIKVLLDGEEILISGLQDAPNLERVSNNNNKFVYSQTITGGGTIEMFKGIDFTNAPSNLTSNNITIEVIANVTKVA